MTRGLYDHIYIYIYIYRERERAMASSLIKGTIFAISISHLMHSQANFTRHLLGTMFTFVRMPPDDS